MPMGDPRFGMASLLFHRERGNAWTERRTIRDGLRLSAAGVSKRQIVVSLGVSATAARD
jgi:hypothetical protein